MKWFNLSAVENEFLTDAEKDGLALARRRAAFATDIRLCLLLVISPLAWAIGGPIFLVLALLTSLVALIISNAFNQIGNRLSRKADDAATFKAGKLAGNVRRC